jgi:hypothetical protein
MNDHLHPMFRDILNTAARVMAPETGPERLWLEVADVLRIVDANESRQDIERALIANLPSNGGPRPSGVLASAPARLSNADIYAIADRFGHRYRTADEEGMTFDKHAVLDFARAILARSAEAPVASAIGEVIARVVHRTAGVDASPPHRVRYSNIPPWEISADGTQEPTGGEA